MTRIEDGRSYPVEDNQPEQQGFSVNVSNPTRLFRAIRRSYSGEIGRVTLQDVSRIAAVKLECRPYYDEFDITALLFQDSSVMKKDIDQNEFTQLLIFLKKRYGEVNQRKPATGYGTIYSIKGPHGTAFRISTESGRSIELQLLQPKDGSDQRNSIKELTKERFDALVGDFIHALQTTVEGIYESNGTQPSAKSILLTVPKFEQKVDMLRYPIPKELEGKVDLEVPDVSFEDIGGQEKAKRELQKISVALDHPDLYQQFGTRPPKGVLLHGPPGTGKTLLAKALASESDAFFVYVSLSEITSKWYGDTEKAVTQIFDWAAQVSKEKPAILFFDEIDSIAIRRENAHEATQRALSAFLTSMSGFKSGGNTIVIGATNRMESIDRALLRPDRFDRKIYVGLPDARGLRHIFDIKKRQAEDEAGRTLFAPVDYDEIIAKMNDFSGADVGEIVRRALEEKVVLKANGEDPGLVTTQDILVELGNFEGEPRAEEENSR